MSTWPYDPAPPQFPWYQPPVSPTPPAPSSADLPRNPPTTYKPLAYIPPELIQPKRPRIFVSYQHATDQYYYNEFSRIFHDTHECVYDSSLDDEIDSDDHDYIKQRIRSEFIAGTSCTVVLVGPTSYQRKHLDWEIKATLDKEHGLIGVQLPNLPVQPNNTVIVPDRLHFNIKSGYAAWTHWNRLIAEPRALTQIIAFACSRPTTRIVNSKEIKKQNG